MGIPLCAIYCFSLAAFNICSLCLIFVNLINMCFGVFRLGFILFGTLWVSWTWVIISFPILGKFSTIISSSIFSWSFFLSSSSGTPYNANVCAFDMVPEVSETSLSSFHSFTLFYSSEVISTILSSSSLIHPSASDILLLIPSRVILISVIVLFVSVCLFFNSSRSLLTDSGILSIFFQGFLIIFTIIILNSFSGSLPISSSFIWTSVFLVCSFICVVFLCLLIIIII